VLFPAHAFTARFSALGKALNQRRAQDGTEPAKLLEEFAPTQRKLLRTSARHVLTFSQVLRKCKEKMFQSMHPPSEETRRASPTIRPSNQKLTGGKGS
jgi:hypothetical protein